MGMRRWLVECETEIGLMIAVFRHGERSVARELPTESNAPGFGRARGLYPNDRTAGRTWVVQ
jgi:hypothetical protein